MLDDIKNYLGCLNQIAKNNLEPVFANECKDFLNVQNVYIYENGGQWQLTVLDFLKTEGLFKIGIYNGLTINLPINRNKWTVKTVKKELDKLLSTKK